MSFPTRRRPAGRDTRRSPGGPGRFGRPAGPGDVGTPGSDDGGETSGGPESGTITAIKSQARDPERVSIFLDGAFAFGLGRQIALDEALRIGDDLSPERVAALRATDDIGKATNAALALLARRPRSVKEVRDRLGQKGYAPEAIDAAVARLEGWNYVGDDDFARYWVENRVAHKPRGERLIAQELWQKGVERETARAAIEAAEIDELGAARDLGCQKLRAYRGLERTVAYRRLGGFLGRRGFGYDVVGPVLDELLAGWDEDGDSDVGDMDTDGDDDA